jgi:hypothetical protein
LCFVIWCRISNAHDEKSTSTVKLVYEDQTAVHIHELRSPGNSVHRATKDEPFERVFASKIRRTSEAMHFNPGIIFQQDGKWLQVVENITPETRVLLMFRRSFSHWGPCDIVAVYLSGEFHASKDVSGVYVSSADGSQAPSNWLGLPWREDPRLFSVRDGLGVSYSVVCAYDRGTIGYKIWQRQGYMLLDRGLTPLVTDVFVPINRNLGFPTAPHYEKNWGFFSVASHLFVLYSVQPFVVYNVTTAPVKLTDVEWSLGSVDVSMRGGAPPVLVDDHWYAFVHTHNVRYSTFVVQFSNFDFQPIAVSMAPVMLTSSDLVFACGALFVTVERAWYVSLGVDDRFMQIVKISHANILSLLVPISRIGPSA